MDQYYVDSSYWDEGYASYLADVSVDSGFYIEEGYFTPDDYYEIRQAFSTLVCGLSEVKDASVELTVTASLSAIISHIEGADIVLTPFAIVTADVLRIRNSSIENQSSEFTFAGAGLRIRTVDAALEASADFAATVEIIEPSGELVDATGNFVVEVTQSADAEKIIGIVSAQVSEFTQTVSAGTIKENSSTISVEFTQIATISHIEGADLFAFSEAELAAAVARLRDYDSALEGVFDIATDYVRFRTASAEADSEFTQSAEGARSRDFDSVIEAAVSLDVSVTKTVNAVADISANFEVTIETTNLQEGEASLVSEFNCSANAIEYIRKPPYTTRVVYGAPKYEQVNLDTSLSKFGQASASRVFDSNETRSISPIAWDGTNWCYLGFKNGARAFFKSTDLETWTHNLITGGENSYSDLIYTGTQYVARPNTGSSFEVSSDGVTWNTVTPTVTVSTRTLTVSNDRIIYLGGFFYVLFRFNEGGSTSYQFSRNSSMTATGWTAVGGFNSGGVQTNRQYLHRGTAVNGNSAVIILSSTIISTGVTTLLNFKTSNGGSSWQSETGYLPTNGSRTLAIAGSNVFRVGPNDVVYSGENAVFSPTEKVSSIAILNNVFFYNSLNRDVTKANATNWSSNNTAILQNANSNVELESIDKLRFLNSKYVILTNQSTLKDFIPTVTHSTNGSNFISNEIPSESIGIKAGLSYSNNEINQWNTIDFWVYAQADAANKVFSSPLINIGLYNFEIQNITINASNIRTVLKKGTEQVAANSSTGVANAQNQWCHCRILKSNTNLKFYFNGAQIFEITNYDNIAIDDILILGDRTTVGGTLNSKVYVDDVYVSKSLLNTYSNTSISVPTSPYSFNTDTIVYLPFDTSLDEINRPQLLTADASLVSTVNLTVNLNYQSLGASLQVSAATMNVSADVIADSIINATCAVEQITDITRIREVESNLNSSVTQIADVVKLVEVNANLNSEFSSNVIISKTIDSIIETDSIAILLSAVAKVGDFLVTLENSTQLSADVVKITDVNSTIEAVTAFVAEGDKTVDFDAALDTAVNISIIGDRIRFADSSQTASFVHSISAIKNTQGIIELNSAFDIVIDSSGLIRGNAELISNFELDTDFDRTRDFNSALECNLTIDVSAIKSVEADATLLSNFAHSIEYDRIRNVETNFESIAISVSAVSKIGDFLINADSSFDLDANVIITAGALVELNSLSGLTAVNDRSRATGAVLESEVTIVANARATTDAALDAQIISNLSANTTVIRSAQVSVNSALTFNTTVVATRNNEIQTVTQSSLTANVRVIRNAVVNSVSRATTTINVARRRAGTANISSNTNVVVSGRIIVIDKFEYIIPREFREFAIHRENREYRIVKENREHIVRG